MVIIKATPESEAGALPSTEQLAAMGRFNEELVKAGVVLAGEGLRPSSRGARVRFDGHHAAVTDGPFTHAKELIAGFWLWQVRSWDEALEWIKRAPMEKGAEVELRQVYEVDDFADNLTSELRAQEKRLRAEVLATATS